MTERTRFAGIVLAGGSARRLSGVDKRSCGRRDVLAGPGGRALAGAGDPVVGVGAEAAGIRRGRLGP
ncbi:hypothetical protein ACFPN7_49105 [Amycolatopsis halotolerans]|uniref:hypothetical protein n=1 Tax=Amycolatopsis halotolerans TaxID=330083 RepID=UPI00361196E6